MKTLSLPPLRSLARILDPEKLNPTKMSTKRSVTIAVIISLLVHLAIFTALVLAYSDTSKLRFAKDRLKTREIELQMVPPDEPPPFTIVPPAPEQHFMDSRGLDISKDPAERPLFESDENMRAASESPALGDLPLPSQEGKDLAFNAFATERSLLGPTARPFTPVQPLPPVSAAPPPPPTDVALEPPGPVTPDDKAPTPNQQPSKPTDLKAVEKLLEDEIALTKQNSHPKPSTPRLDTPPPLSHAAKLRTDEPITKLITPPPKVKPQPPQPTEPPQLTQQPPQPQPQQPPHPPGYQPEQLQNRIEGNISNRGKKSIDAIATPMGRYRKQVNDAIGSRWYYYIHDRMDLLAFGSVQISFVIDPKGHVSHVRVDSNTSNSTLSDVSTNAIRDAEIAPPPLDPASPMSQEPLEWTLTFTYYPFAK